MFNEIIVNVHSFEKRIAILEDNKLVELFTEKKEQQLVMGNVYKGIIKNVLPGMGAAFVEIGLKRTAFLHYKDLDPNFLSSSQRKIFFTNNSANIDKILTPGEEIAVQVKKEPLGKKGARLTCKLSLPGKFLVYIPKNNKIALSRKITSSSEKKRIKSILESVTPPNTGVIVRTEADGISEEDFIQEMNGLNKTWKLIEKQLQYAKAPVCVFDENDLSFTLVRDLFSSKVDRLVVDDKSLQNSIVSRLQDVSPELIKRIELYNEDSPIFDAYGIEKEIEEIFDSKINLPSGGNITIQQTEALVAIDVNTGSFTGISHYEDTIKKTNIEAAYEMARQIRLRDLSGIMVADFIDMKGESDKEEVYSLLKSSLKRDRAKNRVFPFSPLGVIEISRKRTRPSLLLTYSEQCPYCNGSGHLLSKDSVAVRISRWLKRAEYFLKNVPLKIIVHKNVKKFFEDNSDFLQHFENKIEIVSDNKIEFDKFQVFSIKDNKEITSEYNT